MDSLEWGLTIDDVGHLGFVNTFGCQYGGGIIRTRGLDIDFDDRFGD